MKATTIRHTAETAENIIPLAIPARAAKSPRHVLARFKIREYQNPRTGTQSWRVEGIKRDGTRIRENFQEQDGARVRQGELETEYLTGQTETTVKATKLTEEQIRFAENAFARLNADADMPLAVQYWLSHGKKLSVVESPRLDDAFAQYGDWLTNECKLRDLSKSNLRRRVNVFVNSVPNIRVADIMPDTIESFLAKRNVSAASKDNDRRAVSSFITWCMDRKRKWIAVNPCGAVRIDKGEKTPPAVLTLEQCKMLLAKADKFKGGRLAPFVAACLFGGLRPFESRRLSWDAVNLKDGEIRLEGVQTKTGKPRVIAICDTLAAWLQAHKGKAFYPSNWRRDFDAIKSVIGYGRKTDAQPDLKPWIDDIMRHTAISHYFRKTGSYGQTAEQFGNSEAIIKAHYQGRVSSEDNEKVLRHEAIEREEVKRKKRNQAVGEILFHSAWQYVSPDVERAIKDEKKPVGSTALVAVLVVAISPEALRESVVNHKARELARVFASFYAVRPTLALRLLNVIREKWNDQSVTARTHKHILTNLYHERKGMTNGKWVPHVMHKDAKVEGIQTAVFGTKDDKAEASAIAQARLRLKKPVPVTWIIGGKPRPVSALGITKELDAALKELRSKDIYVGYGT